MPDDSQITLAAYLRALSTLRGHVESTPELSLRQPLLELLQGYAATSGRRLLIAAEANAEDAGQPDIFFKDGPRLVGFAETKAPGEDLRRVLRTTDQGKRYLKSLPNWVLTDYYSFMFIREGEVVETLSIADPDGASAAVSGAGDQLQAALLRFFSYAPPVIRSPRRLALELARRARLLRDGLRYVLDHEAPSGPLRSVLAFYQQTLMSDLDEEGFADTFAQTIAYGMFLARLREEGSDFTREIAARSIPPSVPFLRSAVRLITDDDFLAPSILRLLDDLAALLQNTQIGPIRREVAAGGLEHDLIIYFYERFLEQYDAGERMKRGVYYTAPQLVGYLIRATQRVLAQEFSLEKGLADESVTLLDPAVGTGTFLLGAAEQALAIEEPRGSAAQRRLIRQHLLKNFYGFELLPAPYAVAHLKMSSYFSNQGYDLADDERVGVYLTNSLELNPTTTSQLSMLPVVKGIVEEAQAAGHIKDQVPVLVIVGNPPYDRTSHNSNPFSDRLQDDFYKLDGARIPDRNTGPLRDDYLRFMRWSVWKLLEQNGAPGHGILAFVTNRAWIERPLHRAVRRFLLERFDEIHVLDLHGDQREWFRDRVDEKVFPDVQAGIALTVFVKRAGPHERDAVVRYRDSFGTREEKLSICGQASLDDESWQSLSPKAPLWLLVPYDVPPKYELWPSVDAIFPTNVIGVQTHRDQLVVAASRDELDARLAKFADTDGVPDSYWKGQGVKKNRDWSLSESRKALGDEGPRNVIRWAYRAFDYRWIAFDTRLIDYTRTAVSPHLLDDEDRTQQHENVALVFAYGSLPDGAYAFVSRTPVPAAVLSHRTFGQAYFAPLWLYEPLLGWRANIADGLLEKLAVKGIQTTPEKLLAYVYGVLNSPGYRATYAHGLRYGFSRVPIALSQSVYRRLAEIGAELVALHLLDDDALQGAAPRMEGNDEAIIGQPRHDAATLELHLGADLVAAPVPAEVWSYQQGSYRVLNDYLEARAGRALTNEEFEEFPRIVAAISQTIGRLAELDELVIQAAASAFEI